MLCGLLCLTTQSARAHQDPAGDSHPQIEIEDDAFVIYSRYRVYLQEGEGGWYRQSYGVTGQMREPRHRMPEERAQELEEATRAGWNPEPTGSSVESGGGGPFLLMGTEEGTKYVRPLPVSGPKGADVERSLVVGQTVGFLWSGEKIIDENADERLRLSFAALKGFAPGQTVTIGKPCTIYHFPVVSNLVWAGGRWWVAWVRDDTPADGTDGKRIYHTILSSVDPKSGKVTHEVLPGTSNWNSSLSLATHGGWLCAAWHASIDGTYPGIAKVVAAFHKVPLAP